MRIMTAVATVLIAGSAVAGPCETAKRGTYLSNVCWLFEGFPNGKEPSRWSARIVEADREACTVVMEKPYRHRTPKVANPYKYDDEDWHVEIRKERWTLFLERADLRESDVQRNARLRTTCLRLRGEDVTDYDLPLRGKNTYVTCGNAGKDRVMAAVRNLYARYCKSRKTEF